MYTGISFGPNEPVDDQHHQQGMTSSDDKVGVYDKAGYGTLVYPGGPPPSNQVCVCFFVCVCLCVCPWCVCVGECVCGCMCVCRCV